MALATEVEHRAPCGCGRMRLGEEGDRRPGPEPCRPGGSSRCPWAGAGARHVPRPRPPRRGDPRAHLWFSGAPALANGRCGSSSRVGLEAPGGRGMAATASPQTRPGQKVRTVTPLASRLRRRTSSTARAVCCGRMISATCAQKDGSAGISRRPRPLRCLPGLHNIQLRQRCTAYKSDSSGAPIPAQMLAAWRGQLNTCFLRLEPT